MPNGTGLDLFRPHHPKRYFDVGIAEEHAVVFAAGMATRGFRPVCAIYSTFLQRAFDPIVHDVCLQKLPVLFCMDRAGLSGDDGPTHHGLFDIATCAAFPRSSHGAQRRRRAGRHDEDRARASRPQRHPLSARRGRRRGAQARAAILPIGKAEVLSDGSDVAILGLGPMISLARNWPPALERDGYSAAVINPRFIKPLDREMLARYARRVAAFVTFEDHVKDGRLRLRRR
jgi:1-deoxy-D-xylulose-5-phosphate synthase